MSMVSNPIDALLNANYIGILVYGPVGRKLPCVSSNETAKPRERDMSNAGVTAMG